MDPKGARVSVFSVPFFLGRLLPLDAAWSPFVSTRKTRPLPPRVSFCFTPRFRQSGVAARHLESLLGCSRTDSDAKGPSARILPCRGLRATCCATLNAGVADGQLEEAVSSNAPTWFRNSLFICVVVKMRSHPIRQALKYQYQAIIFGQRLNDTRIAQSVNPQKIF